jgi:hypothetical protein
VYKAGERERSGISRTPAFHTSMDL